MHPSRPQDWVAFRSTLSDVVQLTIDGRQVSVPRGTTIFDAARLNGVSIPTLCHQQHQTPVGVCRVCVVDVGARVSQSSLLAVLSRLAGDAAAPD